MKRILCLCLLLAVLFSAASCEPIGLPRPAPNYSASEDLAQNVEADSIRYYCSPTTKYNVFILERDGKFGVIDGFGKVLVEPTWDCATLTHTAKDESEWGKAEVKVLLSNRTENGYPRMEGMFVEADGTLTEGTSGGWDYGRSLVYWDSNEKTPLLFSSGDGITEFRSTDVKDYRRPFRSSAYFFAAADTREKVVAVQAISDYELVEENGGVHLYVTEEKDGKYALLSLETGKLLTDFVYEDYDRTGEVNDVIAMKKTAPGATSIRRGARSPNSTICPATPGKTVRTASTPTATATSPSARVNCTASSRNKKVALRRRRSLRTSPCPPPTDATGQKTSPESGPPTNSDNVPQLPLPITKSTAVAVLFGFIRGLFQEKKARQKHHSVSRKTPPRYTGAFCAEGFPFARLASAFFFVSFFFLPKEERKAPRRSRQRGVVNANALVFLVGPAKDIVRSYFMKIGKLQENFRWDIQHAALIIGINALTAGKCVSHLCLCQISIFAQITNSFVNHETTYTISSAKNNCGIQYSVAENPLLTFSVKSAKV